MSRTRSRATGSRFSTSVIARASARLSPARTPSASASRLHSRRFATAETVGLRDAGGDGGARACERGGEEVVLLRRPDGHPDRLRRTEPSERAHNYAFAEQRVEQRRDVLPSLGVDEVRDRRPGDVEPCTFEHPGNAPALLRDLPTPPAQLVLVAERR